MTPPSNMAERVRARAVDMLRQGPATHDHLNSVLRLLAKYRSVLLQNTVLRAHGTRVQGGPFAGLEFIEASAEGCHLPKLLGCYERELHGYVEAAVAVGYPDVVNIGAAEGYYAVGLARRCPDSAVRAYDSNPTAQHACRELAARNGVAGRVTVGGLFAPADFRTFAGRQTLFVIDIEGAEQELVEGVPAGVLADADLIIECHDSLRPGISDRLARRLAEGHEVRVVKHDPGPVALPPLFEPLGHLDQLLAVWEWRSGPTPWVLAAARRWADSPFLRAVRGEPIPGT